MTVGTAEVLDLSRLPPPTLVTLDYEKSVADRKTALIAGFQAKGIDFDTTNSEFEPAVIVEEVDAGREMIGLQAINDAGKANMLAFSRGNDLDNLGALQGVTRLVIGTDSTTGLPIMERDDRYLRRIQLAPEAKSTGSLGYYIYHCLTAVPTLGDATAVNPAPGQIVVTVMGSQVDPTPTDAEVAAARTWCFREDIKGATHELTVQPATVLTIDITAALILYDGPDQSVVQTAALATLNAFLTLNKRLGRDLRLYAWVGRLQQDTVYGVQPLGPLADISANASQVVWVRSVTLQFAGRDQ